MCWRRSSERRLDSASSVAVCDSPDCGAGGVGQRQRQRQRRQRQQPAHTGGRRVPLIPFDKKRA
jgi:hypothetical protein|eukprot:SAG25_NODE_835_length_5135_cov_3.455719_5_plen_64_part_00